MPLLSICKSVALVTAIGLCSFDRGAAAATMQASAPALAIGSVKHVFIIVQENHTFDNYFGLYPGVGAQRVENLGSVMARADDCIPDPAAGHCQRPFLISANPASPAYVPDAPDANGGENSRAGQIAAIDRGAMDGFLRDIEGSLAALPAAPTAAQVQAHNAALSIAATYDCDTIPYLWSYAKNFALFDHYFQADTGPSTPGNVQLFAGQSGQTQALSGGPRSTALASGKYTDGVPIVNDNNPPPPATASIPPYQKPDAATFQSYATMPVLLNATQDAQAILAHTTGSIASDLSLEAQSGRAPIPWAWYEEGLYSSIGFVAHHAAPLYFDYINASGSPFGTRATLRDNTPRDGLVADIAAGTLASTGVYWIKGGKKNQYGLSPADSVLAKAGAYVGDDDHPNAHNSDYQIAETYVATLVNAIARSAYWKDSVILLTWDDSGGLYDHVAPPQFGGTCPADMTGPQAGSPCGDGVRLPMLVISPFARTGAVVHDPSDAGSVSKFLETVFSLPTFASLPNEAVGIRAGATTADANAAVSDLTGALDPEKLSGREPPNDPALAIIASPTVAPTMTCASLGLKPIASPASIPAGFKTAGAYLRESLANHTARSSMLPSEDSGD